MSHGAGSSRPPSPPHSLDGTPSSGGGSRTFPSATVKAEPFTPPMPHTSINPEYAPPPVYDPYGDPTLYHMAPTPVYYTPQAMITSAPSHTPPHPMSDHGVRTRSGRASGTPSSRGTPASTRMSESPRPKARRALRKKAGKKGGPNIDQPLSVLTQEYTTPVRDMAAWVTRPVEERMAEVAKKKGYISRPMNSFMLYRSAYAERVKQFCKENNHQVVSQVTGASWPLEPQDIRDLYERLAIMERDNHQAAHPNYKFAPNKSGKRPRPDDDDAATDSDPDWSGSTRSSKRSRSVRRFNSRSASSTPFDDRPIRYQAPLPASHFPGYDMGNPYGPAPLMIGPNGMVGEFYPTTAAVAPFDHVGDLRFEKVEPPFPAYAAHVGLGGLPHGGHHELLTSYPVPQPMTLPVQHDVLDPRLGHADQSFQLLYPDGSLDAAQDIPRTIAYDPTPQVEFGYQPAEPYHPGLATLTSEHDVWAEPAPAGSDFEAEFQRLG